MTTYPLVKTSQNLNDIAGWNPLLSRKPQKPPMTQKPEISNPPALPHKPPSPSLEKESIWISSIFLIIIIFFFFNLADEKSNIFYGLLAWMFIIILIYRSFDCMSTNGKRETQYRNDFINYPKALKDWEFKCISINREYEEKSKRQNEEYEASILYYNNFILPEYKSKLANFQSFLLTEEAKEEVLNTRKEAIEKYISVHVSKPVDYNYPETPKKGVSESDFVQYLQDTWDEDTFGKIEISTNKTVVGTRYLPDITLEYLIGQQKLCVDVEIDEPYVGATGQPIHYVEGTDNIRDDFFVRNGWIVVRFAEEQVVNKPFLCYIHLLVVITGLVFNYNRKWLDFESRKNSRHILPQVTRWTKDEAHAMAFKRYRNSYLKKEFIENLPTEKS